MVSPQAKREAVTVLMTERDFGVTRACGLLQISRALYCYQSRRPPCAALRERIAEIAALKRRYGYRRIHVLLRRPRNLLKEVWRERKNEYIYQPRPLIPSGTKIGGRSKVLKFRIRPRWDGARSVATADNGLARRVSASSTGRRH